MYLPVLITEEIVRERKSVTVYSFECSHVLEEDSHDQQRRGFFPAKIFDILHFVLFKDPGIDCLCISYNFQSKISDSYLCCHIFKFYNMKHEFCSWPD